MAIEEELFDYYFSDELLSKFSQRFRIDEVIRRFVSAVKGKSAGQVEIAAEELLGKYLQEFSRSLVTSGRDPIERTGELVYHVAEKTGIGFPSIPQRLLELAFMSTRPRDKLVVSVSTPNVMVLRVVACDTQAELKKSLGEEKVRNLPCRCGCMANSKALFDELNMPVESKITAKMNEEGYCEFTHRL